MLFRTLCICKRASDLSGIGLIIFKVLIGCQRLRVDNWLILTPVIGDLYRNERVSQTLIPKTHSKSRKLRPKTTTKSWKLGPKLKEEEDKISVTWTLCVAQKGEQCKSTKSAVLESPKEGVGKGGRSRNAWKEARQAGSITSTSTIMEALCTKVPPYNNCPLVLCFLKNCPKAVECIQCLFEIPRRPIIVPLDIVLEYEGIWVYPDPTNKGKQLPSTKYTTKYYCVKRSCTMERFPYFSSSLLLKVSSEVRSKLTQLSILE